jgi:hypothetical protein
MTRGEDETPIAVSRNTTAPQKLIAPHETLKLVLDMVVRWSSTYHMILRAWHLRNVSVDLRLCFTCSSAVQGG